MPAVDFTKFGGVPVDAPAGPAVDFAKLGGVPVEAAAPDPTAGMSNYEKAAAGMGGAFVGAGRAVKEASIGLSQGLQKIPGIGKYLGALPPEQLAELSKQSDAASVEAKAIDAPLLATGAGRAGNIAGNVAMFAPTALIPGANTYTGSALIGAVGSGLTTEGDLAERAKAAGIGAAGGVAGKYIGGKIGEGVKYLKGRSGALAEQEALNATKDATLTASREAGYTLPPTMANPSMANKVAEGYAGKLSTAQSASIKNQPITNDLVRKEFGLANDVELTKDTFAGIRKEAGTHFEAVKNAGPITTDAKYTSDLMAVAKKHSDTALDFPDMAKNEIVAVVESVNKPGFKASSAVDKIKDLRNSADKAYRSGDKALGKDYRAVADAMEEVVERNLQKSGQTDLLANFREARQTIAKSYTVEKALNSETGNVSATKLGSEWAKGKPLTGGLKTAAQFARAYPTAAKETVSSMPGASPLDHGVALLSLAADSGLGLANLIARPKIRAGILSPTYQKLMTTPNYQQGKTMNALAALANTPGGENTLRLLASGAGGLGSAHMTQ